MRRTNVLISLFALALGLLAGAQLRPAWTQADDAATPEPWVAVGFDSDSLIDLVVKPITADPNAPTIEVRNADGSTAPATLTLARYTYEPGGHIAMPYPYPGPVAYYVDSGTLTLEAIGPGVKIADVQRPTSTDGWTGMTVRGVGPGLLTAGGRYEVEAGNFVYTLDGDLGPTRNDGDGPSVVLAVFLQPTSGETWAETSGTPVSAP